VCVFSRASGFEADDVLEPVRAGDVETEEAEMNRRFKVAIGTAAAAAVIAGGAVVATASGSEEDAPLTGNARQRATAAALAHVGEGTVVGTEVGEGGVAYGVEIRLDDGSQVDVKLDDRFRVIATEADDDGLQGEDPADDH
jgi:hypothetical protein